MVFYPDTVPALRALQAAGFVLFLVTHQAGVGMGLITRAEADRVSAHVADRLREAGIGLAAVYCCPHRRDEGCGCIKPKPHFLHLAARDHGIDLARSYAVGDHPHDVDLAVNAGGTGIYVLTGHGEKHRGVLRPGTVVHPGIGAAAAWILADASESA